MKESICATCGKKFLRDRAGKFCSRSCSAKTTGKHRVRTEDSKEKIRKIMKEKYERGDLKVPMNGRPRLTGEPKRKYYKPTGRPAGGYRPHSGRSKSGYYRGIYVSSTWECAFLIYHLEHGNQIERCELVLEYPTPLGIRRFYPDFVVNGEIIEIKGPQDRNKNYKIAAYGEVVTFMFKEDLQSIFAWVRQFTGRRVEDLYQLYDEAKPDLPFCCVCGKMVKTKRNRFCGNSCSAKSRHQSKQVIPTGIEPIFGE